MNHDGVTFYVNLRPDENSVLKIINFSFIQLKFSIYSWLYRKCGIYTRVCIATGM